jgi:hypothetical protein
MPTAIHNEQALLGQLGPALDTLERTTGVKGRVVTVEPKARNGRRPDALIDIYVEGKRRRYVVEAKTRLDRLAALGHVRAQLDHLGERGLLFAPYITPAIAKQCRQLDIPFIDTAGNAYLHEPGLLVYITGEKPEDITTATMGTRGGGTATALRVVFVLLCKPDLLNAPYRNIVEAANVALGAIGWVFFDLEKRGYVAGGQKKHNRRFLEPIRLFEEWVTNYPIKLRPKLNPRRFRTENPEWWKHADVAELHGYWGGEVAAQRLTKYLKPATYTLYIEPKRDEGQHAKALATFIAANRLRADAQGDIEILDAFWNLPPTTDHPDVVPPILAYADLMATFDPRNIEVAKLIREKYIDDAFHQA